MGILVRSVEQTSRFVAGHLGFRSVTEFRDVALSDCPAFLTNRIFQFAPPVSTRSCPTSRKRASGSSQSWQCVLAVDSRNQTLHHVLNALSDACRERPGTGLTQDMQSATLFEHIEMRVCSFSIEADAHHRFANVQVTNEDFRKPIRQLRIKQQ